MTTNCITKPETALAEAPASWNTRYITPEGFECQLTLRGETGQDVLERATGAIAFLLKSGCIPCTKTNNNHISCELPTNNNGNHPVEESSSGNGNGHGSSWCPIHQCEMRKWEKDGRVWYSHKTDDAWCSGKAKRK